MLFRRNFLAFGLGSRSSDTTILPEFVLLRFVLGLSRDTGCGGSALQDFLGSVGHRMGTSRLYVVGSGVYVNDRRSQCETEGVNGMAGFTAFIALWTQKKKRADVTM